MTERKKRGKSQSSRYGTPKSAGGTLLENAEVRQRLLNGVRRGHRPQQACCAAGITYATFWNWKKKAAEGEEPYASFFEDIARASAEGELELQDRVLEGDGKGESFGKSRAALAVLERVYRRYWAPTVNVKLDREVEELLDVVQGICSEEDFVRICEALAARDRQEALGGDEDGAGKGA